MDNISFNDWVLKNFKKTRLLLISLVPVIMFFIDIARQLLPSDLKNSTSQLSAIHKIFIENSHIFQYSLNILLILVLLLIIAFRIPNVSVRYPNSAERVKIFWFLWLSLWLAWLSLFILHFSVTNGTGDLYKELDRLKSFSELKHRSEIFVWLNFGNNASTLIFGICYLLLHSKSKYFPAFIILFSISLISVAAIEYKLESISIEGNKFEEYKNYVQIFYSISKNSCAVAMILFAGRLESRVMGAPLPLVFIFYLYGASQFLSYDFVIIFLIGKISYFLFFDWLFSTGRLQFFFEITPKIENTLIEERNSFLKSHS
ncbi:hypothetical protein JWG45_03545 [Leptospira sp. 201903070]|uniref:Uncharacterized protein n=1 Tax=Leptospira ainlahdjerensis TaxID=2810033 RepID=A0ABS2U777_9LEPT|nr:hypothetical protein [Leptospira ainlahdjerensis]MBM9576220.1 hypothetical protein [Leptospira ainlahdjerensis]